MFDRFDDDARRAMHRARLEALARDHEWIGTEHILLGIVALGRGRAVEVLAQAGLDLTEVRAAVETIVERGPHPVSAGQLPFTPRAKRVLELALEEASRLGHTWLGTEHLLLGLIAEDQSVAAQVLTTLGLTLAAAREEVARLAGSGPAIVTAAAGAVTPPVSAATAATAAPRPRSIVARWLTHWSFWPVYSLAIVLLLLWLRPWQKWLANAEEWSTLQSVRVHATFPAEAMASSATGSIVLVASATSEPGPDWLPCDGRRLERVDYAKLFARIGEQFGADATGFRLPDYRGLAWAHIESTPRGMRMAHALQIAVAGTTAEPADMRSDPIRFWIRVR